MRYTLLVALLVVFLVPLAHAGKFYKWVDEDGNVHYTDSPPEHVEYTEIGGARPVPDDGAPTPAERIERWRAEQDERAAARAEQTAEAEREQERAQLRATNCENARERVQVLEQNVRILLPPEEEGGEPVRMADDERMRQLEQAREAVREFCD